MFFIVWDMADIGMTYNAWVAPVMVALTVSSRLINWDSKRFTYRLNAGRTQLAVRNSRRFMVRRRDKRPKRGVFITAFGFTSQARDFAHSVEGMVLVDSERLAHLMIENEVGVSSRLVKVPKLDMD